MASKPKRPKQPKPAKPEGKAPARAPRRRPATPPSSRGAAPAAKLVDAAKGVVDAANAAQADLAAENERRAEAEKKSQAAAAEFIAGFVADVEKKAPPGFLETGHMNVDAREIRKAKRNPTIQDGIYSDKQVTVRFEDGRFVEAWRADAPGRPGAGAQVGNA